MKAAHQPDLEVMSTVASRMFKELLGREVPKDDITVVLREALYGDRDLWRAVSAGLITRREMAGALLAHVHSSLVSELGLSWDTEGERAWEDRISEMENALS
jgi:hypothetical protein